MKSDIRWNEIAKIEMHPDAPEQPAAVVKAIARNVSPPQKKQRPASKGRVRKGKSGS